jgi:hypothetical protein
MNMFGSFTLAAGLLLLAAPAQGQDCTPTTTQSSDAQKATPSAVGKDGTGATGWTGAAGGNSAGIEDQKKNVTEAPGQPRPLEEAKGLDLKGAPPQKRC